MKTNLFNSIIFSFVVVGFLACVPTSKEKEEDAFITEVKHQIQLKIGEEEDVTEIEVISIDSVFTRYNDTPEWKRLSSQISELEKQVREYSHRRYEVVSNVYDFSDKKEYLSSKYKYEIEYLNRQIYDLEEKQDIIRNKFRPSFDGYSCEVRYKTKSNPNWNHIVVPCSKYNTDIKAYFAKKEDSIKIDTISVDSLKIDTINVDSL